jgi:flagella basal body P-ring formation protein FlgA
MKKIFPLIFLLLATLPTVSAEVTINLHTRIIALQNEVRLGEIADIYGQDHLLVAKLNSLYIGALPENGQPLKISRMEIQRRIYFAGISLKQVEIFGPLTVTIAPPLANMKANLLSTAVLDFLSEFFAPSGQEYEVDFRHLPKFDRPLSPYEQLKVMAPENERFQGNVVILVALINNGKLTRKFPVSVCLHTFQNVAVAIKEVKLFQVLDPQDFTLMKRETTTLDAKPVTDLNELKGKRASSPIFRGDILTLNQMSNIPVIAQGDVVKITTQNGHFSISALGRARKSGAVGDIIPVVNLTSLKLINARIIDQNLVTVDF